MLAASTDYYILDLSGTQVHINKGDGTKVRHKWLRVNAGICLIKMPCWETGNQGKASASFFMPLTSFCHCSECRKMPAPGEPCERCGRGHRAQPACSQLRLP